VTAQVFTNFAYIASEAGQRASPVIIQSFQMLSISSALIQGLVVQPFPSPWLSTVK
jgi:hypothetical protein